MPLSGYEINIDNSIGQNTPKGKTRYRLFPYKLFRPAALAFAQRFFADAAIFFRAAAER